MSMLHHLHQNKTQAINDSIPELTRFSHYLGETYKLTENMKVTDDKDTNISIEDITAHIKRDYIMRTHNYT